MAGILKGVFPLKDYKRSYLLGRGSFGAAYKYERVEDSEFPEFVAVKKGLDPAFFQNEVEIMERVAKNSHENLVKCFGIEENADQIYFILELCDEDLQEQCFHYKIPHGQNSP